MNQGEKRDFTQGSILNKLILFMMPVFGALVLQAAYGAVDLLVVGRFGTTAGLSAVSTGSQILNLVTFVITQFAMGITVLIARYIGEKNSGQIGELLGGGITVFTIICIVLFAVMVFFAKPLAILMQAPEEALSLTSVYVKICGGGIFFIVAYNVLAAIFRGFGDSKSPLIFVAVACVVNIIGDLILVAGFHLDAAGAAIATVAAQAVSVVLALIILKKKKYGFRIRKQDFKINNQCKRFIKVGLPLALQEFLTQMSFLALCAFINKLGLEASSGYGVACKIVNFAMLVPSALMQSMASFVSQNVGAGKPDRAKKSMFTGMGFGVIVGVIVFIAVWNFGGYRERSGVFKRTCTGNDCHGSIVQYDRIFQRLRKNRLGHDTGSGSDLTGEIAACILYEYTAGRKPYQNRIGGAGCHLLRYSSERNFLFCIFKKTVG